MTSLLVSFFAKKKEKKGSDLLSHLTAVPSALKGLTSLFGMVRGDPLRFNHLSLLVRKLYSGFPVPLLGLTDFFCFLLVITVKWLDCLIVY